VVHTSRLDVLFRDRHPRRIHVKKCNPGVAPRVRNRRDLDLQLPEGKSTPAILHGLHGPHLSLESRRVHLVSYGSVPRLDPMQPSGIPIHRARVPNWFFATCSNVTVPPTGLCRVGYARHQRQWSGSLVCLLYVCFVKDTRSRWH
jgi:hypothetical protein